MWVTELDSRAVLRDPEDRERLDNTEEVSNCVKVHEVPRQQAGAT